MDLLEDPVRKVLGREIPIGFSLQHDKKDGSRREWMYGTMTVKEKICVLGFFIVAGIATIENDFGRIALSTIRGAPSIRLLPIS